MKEAVGSSCDWCTGSRQSISVMASIAKSASFLVKDRTLHRNNYESLVFTLSANRNRYALIGVFLLVSNLILTITLFSMDSREKTIIVPTGMTKAFYVKGDMVDPVYIEQMSRYIAQLRWTYTESTAGSNFREILHFVSPEQYGELDARFADEATEIQRNQISSAFSPEAIQVYPEEKRAVIRGTHIGYMGTQIINRSMRFLEIRYRYTGDRFHVTGMKELTGQSFDNLQPFEAAVKPDITETRVEQGGQRK